MIWKPCGAPLRVSAAARALSPEERSPPLRGLLKHGRTSSTSPWSATNSSFRGLVLFCRRLVRRFYHFINDALELPPPGSRNNNRISPATHILGDSQKSSARIFL